MAIVITSIGHGTGHSEAVTISSVSGAGPTYTVTLTASVPAAVVIGDVFLDENSPNGRWLITGISGSDLTVFDSTAIAAAPDDTSGNPSSVERYYNGTTPFTDWESELDDGSLYDASDDVVGEIYNDADFNNTFTWDGGSTLVIGTAKLTVPASERHAGVKNTGARQVFSGGATFASVATNHHTKEVSWFDVELNQTASNGFLATSGSATIVTNFIGMLIHGLNGVVSVGHCIGWGGTRQLRVLNSILYDMTNTVNSAQDVRAISHQSARLTDIMNVTIHGITKDNGTGDAHGIIFSDDADTTIQNTIIMDTGGTTSGPKQDFELSAPSLANVDHNMSSDTSSSGTGSLDSGVSGDIFISTTGGSENYHLKTGAAVDPIDAGVDLVTTPTGVNIDIDGRDRDAEGDVWDMGADELVAAAGMFQRFGSMRGGIGRHLYDDGLSGGMTG